MSAIFSSDAVGWWQVVVGILAAAATIWAVLVAMASANKSIAVAREISQRDSDERQSLRDAHAKALAAAFTEELWENSTRAYTIHNFAITYPVEHKLAEYVVGLEEQMQAPVLEGALANMEVFQPDDAQLFARCAVRICQLRRDAVGQRRNIAKGIIDTTIANVADASEHIPALLDEGLARAHEISGVPRTRILPKLAGGIHE